MDYLKDLIYKNKPKEVKNLLNKIIKFYKSNSEIVDHIYVEQSTYQKYRENVSLNKDIDKKVIKLIK